MRCARGRIRVAVRSWSVLVAVLTMMSAAQSASFDALPRTDPTAVGIDAAELDAALDAFASVDGAWAMVVVRHGAVVGERHVVAPAEVLHPVWSVTKSVTATLAGIAIDEGLFSSVEAQVVDALPAELVPSGAGVANIELEHLLTMTSGIQWSEDDDWLPWIASADPEVFILSRTLSTWPGTVFNYSSATSHLPSVMLSHLSGESQAAFADTRLFDPLGVSDWEWDSSPRGYSFGGHGIHLRVEDLSKLGVLVLNDGIWPGFGQVIPSPWVAEMLQPRFPWADPWGSLDTLTYGYLWWLATASGREIYLAWGWGGQFVFCVPELDLVVATAADGNVWAAQAESQELAILGVIVNSIMPAVTTGIVFKSGFESGDASDWVTRRSRSSSNQKAVGGSCPFVSVPEPTVFRLARVVSGGAGVRAPCWWATVQVITSRHGLVRWLGLVEGYLCRASTWASIRV